MVNNYSSTVKNNFILVSAMVMVVILFLWGARGCDGNSDAKSNWDNPAYLKKNLAKFDLADIKKRGKLVALCRYNSSGYFIYKGKPMGYEYELLKRFADHLGVALEIKVPRKWEDLFIMLNKGEGDIIAANLTVTLDRSRKMAFTEHHSTTRQMLVQKKPDTWRHLKVHVLEKTLVRDPIQLLGCTVHVRASSSYYERLESLSAEIGGKIDIVKAPEEMETEVLIKMVARGLIPYTIADENLVKGFEAYYRVIDAKTPISFPQRIAWAVRLNSSELLKASNTWITGMKSSPDGDYYVIYKKYFTDRQAFVKRLSSEYMSTISAKISPYDSLFKHYSNGLGWDWRLVASQAYEESRFDPVAKSWAGATGIMQLMPATLEELGISEISTPDENIRAGIMYLMKLYSYWAGIPDSLERVKFTLASYNAGPGHIQDARRLAKKYGKDPDIWSKNVAEYILKKSEKKYYYDDVVQYGYCRGEEPYNYVKSILGRFIIYKGIEAFAMNVPTG